MKRLAWGAASVAFLAAVVLAWELVADLRWVNPMFLPSPGRSLTTLGAWIVTGELWDPLGRTVWRMFAGWIAASVCGVLLGAAIASSTLAHDLFEPLAEFLRPLPASAVLPPAMLLLGLTDRMIVSVIAFGTLWPILLGAIHGFKALDPRLTEVARVLRFPVWQQVLKFQLPNALPEIFAGMRVALALALILAVVAEMISSQPGVGFMVLVAARAFRPADIFAGIFVLGALGFVTNSVMQRIEEYLLRWRPAPVGG
ncbi:MAG: ABC transporter permease [Burkholderiales bacterium]|nr:ABC transporter permease [Burkholderiales bacterium]